MLRRDHGWIHTLLEEAENERMHLLTFMNVSQPGPFMRGAVLVAQACSLPCSLRLALCLDLSGLFPLQWALSLLHG